MKLSREGTSVSVSKKLANQVCIVTGQMRNEREIYTRNIGQE